MNLNKKIGFLLDTGFTPEFVSKLNENKINLLFEKMSKKEILEAITMVSKDDASTQQKLKTSKQPFQIYEKELEEDEFYTDISGIDQDPIQKSSPDYPGSDRGTTSSLDEKFESKAQQGLFWARCNKCKTDDCKWCKMAKEFSKSTSKKQYKTMPEKKHPEKTVKYNKKETKENFTFKDYLGKLGSTYTSEMAKKVKGTTPTFSESIFEKNLENIIQENLKPTMKKRDLLRLIEASMGDTKEKETETETEKKEKTGNPFGKPNPKPAEAKVKQLQKKLKKLQDELDDLIGGEIDETYQDFMSKVKEKGFLNK